MILSIYLGSFKSRHITIVSKRRFGWKLNNVNTINALKIHNVVEGYRREKAAQCDGKCKYWRNLPYFLSEHRAGRGRNISDVQEKAAT